MAVTSAGPYMQIICTSLQTDNHASTSPLSFSTGRIPFLPPDQQQSTLPYYNCFTAIIQADTQSVHGFSVDQRPWARVSKMTPVLDTRVHGPLARPENKRIVCRALTDVPVFRNLTSCNNYRQESFRIDILVT